MSSFKHLPLGRPTKQIRLFEFTNRRDEKLHELQLVVFEIGSAPKFTAISYEWGSDRKETPVLVDGKQIRIRENLSQCLECIKASYSGRYFWIDALCIDQSNTKERSAQVSVISTIFARSACTIAWIGLPTQEAIDALLRAEGDQYAESWLSAQIDPESRVFCQEMAALLNRSYWSRLWIIQELYLASRKLLMCGKHLLEWYKLEKLMDAVERVEEEVDRKFWEDLSDTDDDEDENQSRFNKARDAHNRLYMPLKEMAHSAARKFITVPKTRCVEGETMFCPRIIQIIATHQQALCLDLRDRVIGLLGLDSNVSDFPVDYSKSAPELYVDMMLFLNQRYVGMPSIVCSMVLQKALMVFSHCPEVHAYIDYLDQQGRINNIVFPAIAHRVSQVMEATNVSGEKSLLERPGNFDRIISSLGLEWLRSDQSFSGYDFSQSQRTMLEILSTRPDLHSELRLEAGAVAYAWPFDIPFSANSVQDLILNLMPGEGSSRNESTPLDGSMRKSLESDRQHSFEDDEVYFLDSSRRVGLGVHTIKAGDVVVRAYGRDTNMYAIRKLQPEGSTYQLLGRVWIYLEIDARENAAASQYLSVDLGNPFHDNMWKGRWPNHETYWAPQVIGMQPALELPHERPMEAHRAGQEIIYHLLLDLRSLVDMTNVSALRMTTDNQGHLTNEGQARIQRHPSRRSGAVDRLRIATNTGPAV